MTGEKKKRSRRDGTSVQSSVRCTNSYTVWLTNLMPNAEQHSSFSFSFSSHSSFNFLSSPFSFVFHRSLLFLFIFSVYITVIVFPYLTLPLPYCTSPRVGTVSEGLDPPRLSQPPQIYLKRSPRSPLGMFYVLSLLLPLAFISTVECVWILAVLAVGRIEIHELACYLAT